MDDSERIIDNAKNLIKLQFTDLPLNRQLGVSRDFVAKPQNVARLMILSELHRNIDTYEDRVKITNIRYGDADIHGNMDFYVDLDIKEV